MKRGRLRGLQSCLRWISFLAVGLIPLVTPLQAFGQGQCPQTFVFGSRFERTLKQLGITDCHGKKKTGQGVTVVVWGSSASPHDCLVQAIVQATAPDANVLLDDHPEQISGERVIVVLPGGGLHLARVPYFPDLTMRDVNVGQLVGQGKLLILAAGNQRRRYYATVFKDADNNNFHDFNSPNGIQYVQGVLDPNEADACVYWKESDRELEIQIVDKAGRVITTSLPNLPVQGTACIKPNPNGVRLRIVDKNGNADGMPFEFMTRGDFKDLRFTPNGNSVAQPRKIPALIIGALTLKNQVDPDSSRGDEVDVMVLGPGQLLLQNSDPALDEGGTSYAAAFAAGLAAIVLSTNDQLAPADVENVSRQLAKTLGIAGTGEGILRIPAGCSPAYCGDGTHDADGPDNVPGTSDDEECDDGNLVAGDGCSPACKQEICGNMFVDFGEECDDGNQAVGDGCRPNCTIEICGDLIKDPQEECDDGNTDNTDACLNTCVAAACGDGFIRTGIEQCDDGNTNSGDGCSSTCQNESQLDLSGTWSICVTAWTSTTNNNFEETGCQFCTPPLGCTSVPVSPPLNPVPWCFSGPLGVQQTGTSLTYSATRPCPFGGPDTCEDTLSGSINGSSVSFVFQRKIVNQFVPTTYELQTHNISGTVTSNVINGLDDPFLLHSHGEDACSTIDLIGTHTPGTVQITISPAP